LSQGALGALALGGISASGGAILAACGSEQPSALKQHWSSPSTTEPPEIAGRRWWLEGGFKPVRNEVTVTDLPIKGALPPELTGLYVRNSSNPLRGISPHWFLGDGMVHGIALDQGKATWYRNRYVQTAYLAAGGGLGAGVPGGASTLSNVSVIEHAGRTFSLGEVGLPMELSASDLSTLGPVDFGGQLKGNFTAHPKIDPATGILHAFGYNFTEPYLSYHRISADGATVQSQDIALPRATMMHDFAITDQDLVFMDLPVVFEMDEAIKMVSSPDSTAVPYAWKPQVGARIGIMPINGSAEQIRWVSIPPCYVYHTVHAHREGSKVVLDVCRLDSSFAPQGTPSALTRHRWTIDTAGKHLRFHDEILDAPPADLPTVDHRFVTRAARHSWLAEVSSRPGEVAFAGCQHFDAKTGAVQRWSPPGSQRSGEWLFVPTAAGEGEGYVMSYVYDPRRQLSSFVVLDALAVSKGPVAEIPLPVRVPYGFHGCFVTA